MDTICGKSITTTFPSFVINKLNSLKSQCTNPKEASRSIRSMHSLYISPGSFSSFTWYLYKDDKKKKKKKKKYYKKIGLDWVQKKLNIYQPASNSLCSGGWRRLNWSISTQFNRRQPLGQIVGVETSERVWCWQPRM